MVLSIEGMKVSEVNMIFNDLVDHLYLNLSAAEKFSFDLIGKCTDINSSFVKLWHEKITDCKSLFLFKILLLSFITWFDHSVLKDLVLASDSEDAQQLLDLFNSKIYSYCNEPITSFPIPYPSQLMLPLDDSEYTILSMKYRPPPRGGATQGVIVLQDVMEIKLTMKRKWEIRSHDIQLVAVNARLELLYWMIPKLLVQMIESDLVHDWKSGIVMVAILPTNFQNADSNDNEKLNGPFSSLNYLWEDDTEVLSSVSLQYKLGNVDTQNLAQQYAQLHGKIKTMKEENERNKIKLNELESVVDMETRLKHTDSLENKAKKKEMFRSTESSLELKVVQQKSEISMLNVKLKTLRKEHEQLVSVHTKFKSQQHRISTDIQTDQQPTMFEDTQEITSKKRQNKISSELHIHQLMNIVPLIQEKWSLIGTRLKLSSDILDDIWQAANDEQIPTESRNTFCCVNMLTTWFKTSDSVSADAITMAIDVPHVGLKTKIPTIEAALTSEYVPTSSSVEKPITSPPEKLEQPYFDMITKFCVELNKTPHSISHILAYLKVCKISPDVYANISDFPELIESFERHGLLNKTDLSWLKNIAYHTKCDKATEVIEKYESLLLADKIPWYSNHSKGTFLVGKTNKKPESVTIKDSSDAKSAASRIVNINESDSILNSSEVGSVMLYWRLIDKGVIEIPKIADVSIIEECRNVHLTHIGIMVDDNLNLTNIDEIVTEDGHLHTLCNQGKYKEVEEFIQTFKADLPLRLASRRGEFGYTPLHEAVNSGHSIVLNLLLQRGGDPNCYANSGYTPLHLAASSGHVDCIRVLLASNADISITNEYGLTPMQIAELNSKHDIMKALRSAEIVREARINGPNLSALLKTPHKLLEDHCLNSALLAVVESGNPSNIGKLILHGATNIDLALAESRNLRQHAVTAALLIIKAAMVNDRILVLHLYGENVKGEQTKLLLRDDDLTKLQAAVANNNIETVIPIEISTRNYASAVREELLLRTCVDKNNKIVLWCNLHLMQLEASWLSKINWVKVLKLAQNDFVSLPPNMGSYLMQCIKLDLQHNKLHKIPQSLLELPSLKELNLSHNALVNIPDVPEWSASLEVLDLSYNHLSNLPNSTTASTLSNLNISNNQFRSVPYCVCSFISLTTLNIANNSKIVALPSELGRLKNLIILNLDGLNKLNYPPKRFQVPASYCIQYLKSAYRLRNARKCYRMKMMIVGKQAMGKSTLVARLLNKDIGSESTVGVDISEWKYTPAFNKKTFYFNIWDFAGQKEYYATYQCFISKHSLYLLVWNITEGDAGIDDLMPWLSNISARAPGSFVIIVGTFLDKVPEEDRKSGMLDGLLHKVAELTQQYDQLQVTNITVVGLKGQLENLGKLKGYIYNAAAEYKVKGQCVMGQLVPSSYHALDSKLSKIHCLVKEGKHEPIMHTAEFQKMVRDCNLDIQDYDELHTVTRFLHEVGSLLHYEDHKNNLDDLYFVDPRWLCNLVSTLVTVKERNPYVKHGILKSNNIPFVFKDHRFPHKYFSQYLTLLNKFEIALPLDKDHKRYLIPSMLPEKCPGDVAQQQPDYKNCYKRFFLFCPTVDGLCCPTPPGLWSRLLSCIMNSVKEVKHILSEQVPDEDDEFVISTNIQRYSSNTYDTLSNYENAFEGLIESTNASQSSPHKEMFLNDENKSLIYWSTGLVYNVNELAFSIQSLAENTKYGNKDGILILTSQGSKGCKILGQLIDIVEKLISEWFPQLHSELEQIVPCSECLKYSNPHPYEFKVEQLKLLIGDHKLSHHCGNNHRVQLIEIVPDLLLADLDSKFLLDHNKLIYVKENESLLGTGVFGKVYRGVYERSPVAIKFYTTKGVNSGEVFKELRSESKVLQQSLHPCLVRMIGVTVNPTMSLVLELAPEGSLHTPLLTQQRSFSRIVLYRIAIQVASGLKFLHSINVIYRDLKADNVLLWSLSPDHLINCKLTDFEIAAHTDPGGTKGLHGTKGFIAPEVSHMNHAREHSVYDHRADIFSFGMFLYQVVARRHPFHNIKPIRIEPSIEEGKRPELEYVSIAEVGLYYMTRVMKLCWAGDPAERPTSQHIIEWLSAPALQLIVSVIPLDSKYSIRNGCVVTPVLCDQVSQTAISSELWICFDGGRGGELRVFTTNTIEEVHRHSMKANQMRCIRECGQCVWVPSRIGLEYGMVNIFDKSTKDLVYSFQLKEVAVSCITSSDHLVYLGTMEGSCFVFPIDVTDIQSISQPHYVYVSEYSIDGLALSQTCLWVSTHNHIYFLNPETLVFEGVLKRAKNTQAFVGKMMLSDNGDMVWSAHVGDFILSAWNAHECTHITDVDVNVCAEENCYIDDLQDRLLTAMCVALDTVWVGLSSGYIMVFAMYPPGELLTYFRPYNSYVRFLSACKYPGPCQKEECLMLCGGKMYQPDDSFKELPDYAREGEMGKPVDTAGVAVLWEVLPAKYTRQVHYLRDGTSWLNYATIENTMNETGFTDSIQYCPSTIASLTSDNT